MVDCHSFSGTPSYAFAKELKALKEDIIQWNRKEFGNVSRQMKELLGVLDSLDAKEGDLGLSKVETHERNTMRSQAKHLLSLEEILWRQKSRMLCIKEGDNNTKFFHKVANSRRRYNHMSLLKVDEVIYDREQKWLLKLFNLTKLCIKRLKNGGLLWKVWSLIKLGGWRWVG